VVSGWPLGVGFVNFSSDRLGVSASFVIRISPGAVCPKKD